MKIRKCHTLAAVYCGVAITIGMLVAETPASPSIHFMARTYHLGSFNQKAAAMWEFVSGSETVDNWTTLFTVIDRADAHTLPELDRVAEGVKQTYQSHGGQVLMAKTMHDASGAVYDYTVVAFEEPAKRRFEVNFVKAGLGAKNVYVAVYGVRITDAQDYVGKARTFITQHSGEIGDALARETLPDIGKLPRRPF